MSTSGQTTWTLQRDSIISAALRKLGVLSGGSSPAVYEVTNATEALNAMLKGLSAEGMPVWAIKSYTFSTVVGTPSYAIGVGQTLNTPVPLKIVQAFRGDGITYSNVPINIYTDYNYNILPIVTSSGVPVNLYYQPQSSFGTINLWPKPSSVVSVTIRYQRPFEDMVNATDELDFPSYWTEAVIYGLAARLAPEYGIPLQDRQLLQQEALALKQQALSFGTEEGSLYIQPDWSGR